MSLIIVDVESDGPIPAELLTQRHYLDDITGQSVSGNGTTRADWRYWQVRERGVLNLAIPH